jgi:rubrerythrin
VASAFKFIAKVEAEHEKRYLKLLENLENDRVFIKEEEKLWMCRNCGYIHSGASAPEKCPACLHPKAYFELKKENY